MSNGSESTELKPRETKGPPGKEGEKDYYTLLPPPTPVQSPTLMRNADAYATMRHKGKLQKLKKEVEALKRDAAWERTPTSETVKDLLDYIAEHQEDDPLLQKKNRSTPSFSCCIL